MTEQMEDVLGSVISSYTRAQAIADGALVDVSEQARQDGFRFPAAMTRAVWGETVEAGGTWEAGGDGETLRLPRGQSAPGRMRDVLWMLSFAVRRSSARFGDRVGFTVSVDVRGDGRKTRVELCGVVGPGDDGEPVVTIMLPDED